MTASISGRNLCRGILVAPGVTFFDPGEGSEAFARLFQRLPELCGMLIWPKVCWTSCDAVASKISALTISPWVRQSLAKYSYLMCAMGSPANAASRFLMAIDFSGVIAVSSVIVSRENCVAAKCVNL